MHSLCSTGAARVATLVFGIGLAAVSGISAFRNGNTLGADEIDKIVFGSGFVFVVGLTWFLPTLAEDRFRSRNFVGAGFISVVWVFAMLFAVWNAVGFTALHRTGAVAGRATNIDRFDMASRDLTRLDAEIEAAKSQKVYGRTGGCTDVTADLSKQFCSALSEKEAARARAKATIDAGKPGSADPQSEVVSWVTGYNPSDLGKAFPVAFGVLVELGAIVAFYAGLGGQPRGIWRRSSRRWRS
jgi:hypothetical protein